MKTISISSSAIPKVNSHTSFHQKFNNNKKLKSSGALEFPSAADTHWTEAEAEGTTLKGYVSGVPVSRGPQNGVASSSSKAFCEEGAGGGNFGGAPTANLGFPFSGSWHQAARPQEGTVLSSDRNPPGTNIATHRLLFQISMWEKATCTCVYTHTGTSPKTTKMWLLQR